jgi:hypothetical protein
VVKFFSYAFILPHRASNFIFTKIFSGNMGAFPAQAPETGLSGVPLRSILCAGRKERFAPLQSLAQGFFRQL